jgi:23S rRNA (guanosine2251-2'-O)-methyltransferase
MAPRPLGGGRRSRQPGRPGRPRPPASGRPRPAAGDTGSGAEPRDRDRTSAKRDRSRDRTSAGGSGADRGDRARGGGGAAQRPQAPSEKRRSGAGSGARAAKQARRRDQLDAARAAVRPGPGRMLIEGRRPVLEALRAARPVDRILLASGVGRTAVTDLLDLARQRGVPVETVPRTVMDAEASTAAHQGILAVVAPIEPIDLLELLALPLAGREPPFFLAMDGIEDPHNLGALARSAEAAGCHGVIVPRHRSAPLSAVAVKSSAGALQHLPVAEVPNLPRAIERLRDSGVWCVGLTGDADASLFDLELADEPVCLVVGGEGAGLHRLVREVCDVLVHIPMAGRVESLNASVAGALALFEVRRRRGLPPSA